MSSSIANTWIMDDYYPIARAASWLDSLGSLWNGTKDEASCGNESEDTSGTSYTTESSEGFVIDENCMISARKTDDDAISDLVDSVDDNLSFYSKCSEGSDRIQENDRIQSSEGIIKLDAIQEVEEETEDHEAFLRSKMSILWYKLQENAKRECISEMPTSKEDANLLDTYGRKKSLIDSLERISPRRVGYE